MMVVRLVLVFVKSRSVWESCPFGPSERFLHSARPELGAREEGLGFFLPVAGGKLRRGPPLEIPFDLIYYGCQREQPRPEVNTELEFTFAFAYRTIPKSKLETRC